MSISVIVVVPVLLVSMLLVSMGIFYVIRAKRLKRAKRPKEEFIIDSDISNGRELYALPAISYKRNEPTPVDFHYVNEHVCVDQIKVDTSLRRMNCCQCSDDCTNSNCECIKINRAGPHYDSQGRLSSNYLKDSVGAIRECNVGCKCNRKRCKNMVIQAGSKLRVVLFKTKSRGWGVRTLGPIAKGTFIGNYSGELISVASSTMREDDTYLFNLSHSIARTADRVRQIKQREETEGLKRNCETNQAEDQYCNEQGGTETSLVDGEKQEMGASDSTYAQQVNEGQFCYETNQVIAQEQQVATSHEYPGQTGEEQYFICDAKYYGNFTRFINHSCEPNVVGIRTFTVHQDERFPYISFFANKNMQAGEELTLNYGDNYWIVKCRRDHIYCLCKAPSCKFTKKTLKQTLEQHKEENQASQDK